MLAFLYSMSAIHKLVMVFLNNFNVDKNMKELFVDKKDRKIRINVKKINICLNI